MPKPTAPSTPGAGRQVGKPGTGVDPLPTWVIPKQEPFIPTRDNVAKPGYDQGRVDAIRAASEVRAAATAATDAAQAAAFRTILAEYDLRDLDRFVDDWVRGALTWDQVWVQLMDPKTDPGRIVDQKYPEMRLRREQGLTSLSIGEIRQWREGAAGILRQAGMPSTFYDEPGDFTPWIVGDVDLPEFQERVGTAVEWAKSAPAETRTALKDLYGVDEGGIAAYVLDRNKALPALERQRAAAGIAGSALRSGFGGLSAVEAERLAALNVSEQQAESTFGALQRSRQLIGVLPGEVGSGIGRESQIGVVAGDQKAIGRFEEVAERRKARMGSGGGFAQTRDGFGGLRPA